MAAALLEAHEITKHYGGRRFLVPNRTLIKAVDGVSLSLASGATVGLVGESGSGKSTLGRILVGLEPPSTGQVFYHGRRLQELARDDWRMFRKKIQFVFQDAPSAINPRQTLGQVVAAPLHGLANLNRAQRQKRVAALLEQVGLSADLAPRYPHELSGGQAQRVVMARALASDPELIVLDEPVSALDVSVQAQILALLHELRSQLGLTYLFISHDLAVVEQLCDEVAVLQEGRIVEQNERRMLFSNPREDYTRRLLNAVPVPGQQTLR